jgi:hypothetical protein
VTASAGKGVEHLREQLAELEDALETFGDPVVAEHAGLQLLEEVLTERAEHIRDTIAEAETTAMTLTLRGELVEEGGLPAILAARLLEACQSAVEELCTDARAAVLHLRAVEPAEGGVAVRLSRRPGLLQAQPTDGAGHLLVDLALRRLVDGLGALSSGASDADEAAEAATARHLAVALADVAVTLRVEVRTPTCGEAGATLDADALAALRG